MQRILKDLTKVSLSHLHKNVFTTTLYELIEAVNEEVEPEEKRIVPKIVIDLLTLADRIVWFNRWNSNYQEERMDIVSILRFLFSLKPPYFVVL